METPAPASKPTEVECTNVPEKPSTDTATVPVETSLQLSDVTVPVVRNTISNAFIDDPNVQKTVTKGQDPIDCLQDNSDVSSYLWKKTATLKLERVSDLTIDLWCNTIGEYYQYEPTSQLHLIKGEQEGNNGSRTSDTVQTESADTKIKKEAEQFPVETNDDNYDAETDVDLDNLLHHAETIVQQAKKELSSNADPGPSQVPV